MHLNFKARCERVRPNNGVTEVLFTHRSNFSNEAAQEQHVLANVQLGADLPVEGLDYIIDIRPAATAAG